MEFKAVANDQGPVKMQDQVVAFGEEDLPAAQEKFDDVFEALNKIRPTSREEFDAGVLKNYERSPEAQAPPATSE